MNSRCSRWSVALCAGLVLAAGPAAAQVAGDAVKTTSPTLAGDGVKGSVHVQGLGDDLKGLGLAVTEKDLDAVAFKLSKLKGLDELDLTLASTFDSMGLKFDSIGLKFETLGLKFDSLGDTMARLDQSQDRTDREREAEQRERERETRNYDQGREAVDQGRYDRAVERFSEVVAMKGPKADAALYFKAYAQNRLGQRTEALATIGVLAKDYPKSRYLTQARALEVEVRQSSGQPVRPESESDEEMKIYALNALQNSAPEQALPMIEKILNGSASPKLKERALFVLAQSNSAQSREILKNIAKGSSTPELQNKAIQYLGVHGGRESRAILAEIYASADIDSKRRILRAFMSAGEKDRVFAAAQNEKDAEVRQEAVRLLGAMSASEELWQLYQKETSVDVKRQIQSAMFAGGDVTRMMDLAKSEKDPDLRRNAVRNLANMGSRRSGDVLVEIYNAEKDVAIKRTVIQGLANQDNATALVALARKEEEIALKKEMIQRLSTMKSKVALDYMVEILGK